MAEATAPVSTRAQAASDTAALSKKGIAWDLIELLFHSSNAKYATNPPDGPDSIGMSYPRSNCNHGNVPGPWLLCRGAPPSSSYTDTVRSEGPPLSLHNHGGLPKYRSRRPGCQAEISEPKGCALGPFERSSPWINHNA